MGVQLKSKKQKLSPRGSVLANKMWRGFFCVEGTWLGWGTLRLRQWGGCHWVRHEGHWWVPNPKPRCRAKIQDGPARAWFWPTQCGSIHFQAEGTPSGWSTLCFRLWGPAIGCGMRGGWLVPKTQKLSHRGSVLANKKWGASVLGRGNQGRARKAWLRERVGVVL